MHTRDWDEVESRTTVQLEAPGAVEKSRLGGRATGENGRLTLRELMRVRRWPRTSGPA